MKNELSYREALIVELVYTLAKGTEEEMGESLEDIIEFLRSKVPKKGDVYVLELLEEEGLEFIDKIEGHLRSGKTG